MKIKDKIKNWYHGERIEVLIPKGMIGLPFVYHTQPPLARFLKVIGKFWVKHWKWIISTTFIIIGLYLTWLQLIKSI